MNESGMNESGMLDVLFGLAHAHPNATESALRANHGL
jgi:hypothetical protein